MKSRLLHTAAELLPSERRLLAAMRRLEFGRFERLKIENGEAILSPWPLTIRAIKFGSDVRRTDRTITSEFALGDKVLELMVYIRGVKSCEILTLAFRHGEPFSMEIETVETREATEFADRGVRE